MNNLLTACLVFTLLLIITACGEDLKKKATYPVSTDVTDIRAVVYSQTCDHVTCPSAATWASYKDGSYHEIQCVWYKTWYEDEAYALVNLTFVSLHGRCYELIYVAKERYDGSSAHH